MEISFYLLTYRHHIAVEGLTETRLSGHGETHVGDYLVLHSGISKRTHGVALCLRHSHVNSLCGWNPISDRILTARMAHKHDHVFIVIEYAFTEMEKKRKRFLLRPISHLSTVCSAPRHISSDRDLNAVPGTLSDGRAVDSTVGLRIIRIIPRGVTYGRILNEQKGLRDYLDAPSGECPGPPSPLHVTAWEATQMSITETATEVVGFRRPSKKLWMLDAAYDTLRKKAPVRLSGDIPERQLTTHGSHFESPSETIQKCYPFMPLPHGEPGGSVPPI